MYSPEFFSFPESGRAQAESRSGFRLDFVPSPGLVAHLIFLFFLTISCLFLSPTGARERTSFPYKQGIVRGCQADPPSGLSTNTDDYFLFSPCLTPIWIRNVRLFLFWSPLQVVVPNTIDLLH